MVSVFLSHSSKDKPFVRELAGVWYRDCQLPHLLRNKKYSISAPTRRKFSEVFVPGCSRKNPRLPAPDSLPARHAAQQRKDKSWLQA
jgi:hypothetical protein